MTRLEALTLAVNKIEFLRRQLAIATKALEESADGCDGGFAACVALDELKVNAKDEKETAQNL